MTKNRNTHHNMRLASCGVKCLNSSSVFQIKFSAGLTVLCSAIPHERQAPKRFMQAENTAHKKDSGKFSTQKQKFTTHLFFANSN